MAAPRRAEVHGEAFCIRHWNGKSWAGRLGSLSFLSAMPSIAFRYESSASGGYLPVLSDSPVVSGPITSQDAGSSNFGIYYQVGGGGVNGYFHDALCPPPCTVPTCLDAVNADLVAAYDAKYGAGAWKRDSASPPSPPPLTSFCVPIPSPCSPKVGPNAVAVMYSVGPDMSGEASFTDQAAYTRIYQDAMAEVARFRAGGHHLDGLRLVMLSTGIYAPHGVDKTVFFAEVAACILDGVVAGVASDPSLADLVILINADQHSGKERTAFDTAATQRGLTPNAAGFDMPVT